MVVVVVVVVVLLSGRFSPAGEEEKERREKDNIERMNEYCARQQDSSPFLPSLQEARKLNFCEQCLSVRFIFVHSAMRLSVVAAASLSVCIQFSCELWHLGTTTKGKLCSCFSMTATSRKS